MLSKAEVEERLSAGYDARRDIDPVTFYEREALETALALWEVAEAATVFRDHVREGFDLDNPLTVMAERDALDAALAALETS